MSQIFTTLCIGIPASLLALFITPLLICRCLASGTSAAGTLATTGIISLLVNTLLPVLLHLLCVPINRFNLLLLQILLALPALLFFRLSKHTFFPETGAHDRTLLMLCGLFTIAVVPLTCLAGIDTYKWLDLAGSVQIEQSIPWFVHPLSLLGFTGRSYPSIQPLVLASSLILSGNSVEWSYYLVSILFGTLGISAACLLGQAVHRNRRAALWTAFLYGFAPVFVRYNHWATGRGLLLAILPLFVLALLKLPDIHGLLLMLLTGFLLPSSHKTGLIAIAAIPLSMAAVPLLPRKGGRILIPFLALFAVAGAVLLSPSMILPSPAGRLAGFIRMAIVRFAWLLPLAAAGLALDHGWLSTPARRRLIPAIMLTFPFACSSNMYGALIALLFVTIAASTGIVCLEEHPPEFLKGASKFFTALTVVMVLLGALGILVNRSLTAMPRRIRDAALFLDSYDPDGPYMVKCKPWRPQIQGYVSGCPRFSIERKGPITVIFRHPPTLIGPPARILADWVSYTRHMFTVTGYSLDYYGKNPRYYYFVIDGVGDAPRDAECIYRSRGVEILKPSGQSTPAVP